MVAKSSKTMRILSVFILIVFSFTLFCFPSLTVSALYIPTKEVSGNYTIVYFEDGVTYRFALPESVKIDRVTGRVTVDKPYNIERKTLVNGVEQFKPLPTPIMYGGTIPPTDRSIVFSSDGNYLPIYSGYNYSLYDARNDTLTYKVTELNKSIIGDGAVDIVMTATTDYIEGSPIQTNDVYVYTINVADVQHLTYQGKPYVRVSWKPFEDMNTVWTDTALVTYEFKLRFNDFTKLNLEGFNMARILELGFNSYVTDCILTDYTLSYKGSEENIELYYRDKISGDDIYEDIFFSDTVDFKMTPSGYFSIRYNIKFEHGELNNTSLETVFNIYQDSFLALENPSLSKSINAGIVNERAELGIAFQHAALDYMNNKLDVGTNPSVSINDVDDLNDLDFSFISSLVLWDSPIMTTILSLSAIALGIAVIGYCLVGKKE